MSGLELIAGGDDLATYVIDDLEPNTPAAEVGIRVAKLCWRSTTSQPQTFH